MDIFDQYIFEEIVSEYERSNLTNEDYEELYIRFCNLSHLDEAKPYIFVMRFFGLGTLAEPDTVLDGLKILAKDNFELKGLFFDLKLCLDPSNTGCLGELRSAVDAGYSDKYLKNKSNVSNIVRKPKKESKNPIKAEYTKVSSTDRNLNSVEYITLTNDIVLSLMNTVTKEEYGTRKLVLPSSYNKIGDGACQGMKEVDMLIIPNGYIAIGESAFSWAIIHQVAVPNSTIDIAKNAFKGFTGVIECTENSYAHRFAKKYNIRVLIK